MIFNSLEEYESFRKEGVLHIPIQYVEKYELKQYRKQNREWNIGRNIMS